MKPKEGHGTFCEGTEAASGSWASPYNTNITSNKALGFGVNGGGSSGEHNPDDWPDVPNTWNVQKWYDSYNPGPIYIGLKTYTWVSTVYVELDGNSIHIDPVYGQIFIGKLASDWVLSAGTSVALRMIVDQDKAQMRLQLREEEKLLETRQQEVMKLDKMIEWLLFLQENATKHELYEDHRKYYSYDVTRMQRRKKEAEEKIGCIEEELEVLRDYINSGWLIRHLPGPDLQEKRENFFDLGLEWHHVMMDGRTLERLNNLSTVNVPPQEDA